MHHGYTDNPPILRLPHCFPEDMRCLALPQPAAAAVEPRHHKALLCIIALRVAHRKGLLDNHLKPVVPRRTRHAVHDAPLLVTTASSSNTQKLNVLQQLRFEEDPKALQARVALVPRVFCTPPTKPDHYFLYFLLVEWDETPPFLEGLPTDQAPITATVPLLCPHRLPAFAPQRACSRAAGNRVVSVVAPSEGDPQQVRILDDNASSSNECDNPSILSIPRGELQEINSRAWKLMTVYPAQVPQHFYLVPDCVPIANACAATPAAACMRGENMKFAWRQSKACIHS